MTPQSYKSFSWSAEELSLRTPKFYFSSAGSIMNHFESLKRQLSKGIFHNIFNVAREW